MPAESPQPIARQLLRVVLGAPQVSDGVLLARFVASRDEDAFAEIVRRHGPMVLAACRRVTRHPHDAEDAFQAAFLVLARRAAHLNRPELLANWLYGVAYRTAREARAARRRAKERVVSTAAEPAAPPAPDDTTELREVIDEELAQLPDKYRTAVVLCDLEGLSRGAVATQLGIPEGTLSSRLAHARKVLAERLTRRGVTASVTALTVALAREARATSPLHTLAHTTISAAVRCVPVSPAVSSLADGALKTMLVTRLQQTFGVGLLLCGLIGVGGALAQQLGPPAPLDPNAPPVASTPAAEPRAPEAKKVAAKGIEDEDVPYGMFPSQAVVRIEDGKLIVRQRGRSAEGSPPGGPNTWTHGRSDVSAKMYDPADVLVFDMKGNRLPQKTWKDSFKTDVHALVVTDAKMPHPRELTLFKPDTLLLILPEIARTAPPPAPPGIQNTTRPAGEGVSPWNVPIPHMRPGYVVPSVPPAPPIPPLPAIPTPPVPPRPPMLAPPMPALPLPLPKNIRGTVMNDLADDTVTITIGEDAGLQPGTKLDVYRETGGGQYLGTLVVTKTTAKNAVAEFRPARGVPIDKLRPDELPRKGDSVGIVSTGRSPR